MANSQLTAYATAQLDKGVSREAITQALVGAGWMQADVDAAVSEVMQQRSGTMNVAVTPGASPTVTVSQTQPAASPSLEATTTTVTATTTPAGQSTSVTPASFFATTPSMSMDATATQPKKSLTWLFVLVGILLALGIIGGAAYAFLGTPADTSLLPGASADELATTQQERDQLRTEVSTLTADRTTYESELALFVATTSASVTHTVSGRIATTTAGAWTLTTPHGIVVTVSNAKDAAVAAALAPLKDADASLTGTHAPGSTLLKVTAINGTAIVAATTTSTTTPTGAR